MTDTAALRAAAQAASGGEWRNAPRDKDTTGATHGPRFYADSIFIRLASPDRILALCEDNKELRAVLDNLLRHHNTLHHPGGKYVIDEACEFARQAVAALEGKPTG